MLLNAVLGFLGVVLVAFLSGASAYYIAKRKTSGTVKTTEAETLWGQAEKMRAELSAQIEKLEAKVDTEQKARMEVTQQCQAVKEELIAARTRLTDQSEEIVRLRELLQVTREVAASLKDQVDHLRTDSSTVKEDVGAVKRELHMIQGG